MAESAASRRARVKLQLRDKKGRWIEMGGGVKWFSKRLGREISGKVSDIVGKNALIQPTGKDSKMSKILVPGRDLEVVEAKASLTTPQAPTDKTMDKLLNETDKMLNRGSINMVPGQTIPLRRMQVSAPSENKVYIGNEDGSSLYSPAKDLKVGDKVVSPDGASPSDPYAVGAAWDKKPVARIDLSGLGIGTVSKKNDQSVSVDLPSGSALPDGSTTSEIGNDKDVIKATPELDKKIVSLKASLPEVKKEEPKSSVPEDDNGDSDTSAIDEELNKDMGAPVEESDNQRESRRAIVEEKLPDNLNESGLTDEEQTTLDYSLSMAEKAMDKGNFDAADRYESQVALLRKLGDARLEKAKTEPAKEESTTPDSAPEAAKTPEPEPEPEPESVEDFNPGKDMPTLYKAKVTGFLRDELDFYNESANESEIDQGYRLNGDNMEVYDLKKASDAFENIASILKDNPKATNAFNRLNEHKASIDKQLAESKSSAPAKKADKPTETKTPETSTGPSDSNNTDIAVKAPSPVAARETPDNSSPASKETPTEFPEGIERRTPEKIEGENYPPTQQQQDVIDAVLGGLHTKVQAKAGTGKTSTLEAVARRVQAANPDKQILYIAFNKSVQVEADKRMPSNTESRTGHSIAYRWAPRWMSSRAMGPKSKDGLRNPADIAGHLGVHDTLRDGDREPLGNKDQVSAAMFAVNEYSKSAADTIMPKHLPESLDIYSAEAKNKIIGIANGIWRDINTEDGGIKVDLDHIRKAWALSRPDFSRDGFGAKKADIVFMDEAQDTPPVLAKVIADQKIQRVVVGDKDQSIYGFTGASDYLSVAEADIELPLNKSWRFGPEVADIGNRFLQMNDSTDRVIGGGPKSKIVDSIDEPDAILVRSNGGMIGEIIAEQEKGRIVGVPKNTKADLTKLFNHADALQKGETPYSLHEDLASFRNWEEFQKAAEGGENKKATMISKLINNYSLGGLRKIIHDVIEEKESESSEALTPTPTANGTAVLGSASFKFKDQLKAAGFKWKETGKTITRGKNKGKPEMGWTAMGTPEQQQEMLDRVKDLIENPTVPDVTISTAHKSKGLEWDKVRIGDDFKGPELSPDGEIIYPDAEELRLAYVAVTRAGKELDPGSLGYVFDHTDENGGIPAEKTPNVPAAEVEDRARDEKEESVSTSEDIVEPVIEDSTSPDSTDAGDDVSDAPAVEDTTAPIDSEDTTSGTDDSSTSSDTQQDIGSGDVDGSPENSDSRVESDSESDPDTTSSSDSAPKDSSNDNTSAQVDTSDSSEPDFYGDGVAKILSDLERAGAITIKPDGKFDILDKEKFHNTLDELSFRDTAESSDSSSGMGTDEELARKDAYSEALSDFILAYKEDKADSSNSNDSNDSIETSDTESTPVTDSSDSKSESDKSSGESEPVIDSQSSDETKDTPSSNDSTNTDSGTANDTVEEAPAPSTDTTDTGSNKDSESSSTETTPRDTTPNSESDLDSEEVDDEGFTPEEAKIIDNLNKDLAEIYRGNSEGSVSDIEDELNALYERGEKRLAGEKVPPYTPKTAPEPSQAEDTTPTPAPTAPVVQSEPKPQSGTKTPRQRASDSGASLADKNGTELLPGDTIGHPKHGPVTVSGVIPSSGRVKFIDPKTGKESSIKASNTAKLDPNAPQEPLPEQSAVGEIGTRFVDSATGLRGFTTADGTRVLMGDRVSNKKGRTGTVDNVYVAADGKAWVNVQWDDTGKATRVKWSVLNPDNSTPRSSEDTTSDGLNDEGLTPTEAARANELDNLIAQYWSKGSDVDPEPFEDELHEILQRGEGRLKAAETSSQESEPTSDTTTEELIADTSDPNVRASSSPFSDPSYSPDGISGELSMEIYGNMVRYRDIADDSSNGGDKYTMQDAENVMEDLKEIWQKVDSAAEEAYRNNDTDKPNLVPSSKYSEYTLYGNPQDFESGDNYSGIDDDFWGTYPLEASPYNPSSVEHSRMLKSLADKTDSTEYKKSYLNFYVNAQNETIIQGQSAWDKETGEYLGKITSLIHRAVPNTETGEPEYEWRVLFNLGLLDKRASSSRLADNITTVNPDSRYNSTSPIRFKNRNTQQIHDEFSQAYPTIALNLDPMGDPVLRNDAMSSVTKMLHKFPMVEYSLSSLQISYDPSMGGTLAYVNTQHNSTPGASVSHMVLNLNPDMVHRDYAAAVRRSANAGHFNHVPRGREVESFITHEFGHVLDSLTKHQLHDMIPKIVDDFLTEKRQNLDKNLKNKLETLKNKFNLSNYALSDTDKGEFYELIAEAFADVEMNRINASEFNKIIHRELMNLLRKGY